MGERWRQQKVNENLSSKTFPKKRKKLTPRTLPSQPLPAEILGLIYWPLRLECLCFLSRINTGCGGMRSSRLVTHSSCFRGQEPSLGPWASCCRGRIDLAFTFQCDPPRRDPLGPTVVPWVHGSIPENTTAGGSHTPLFGINVTWQLCFHEHWKRPYY